METIYKQISDLWESRRLSMRPKVWKFYLEDRKKLDILIAELVRETRKEFGKHLKAWNLINLKDLTPREQDILEHRFLELQTYEEVGKVFGVTRERIRQIEAKALEKLRNRLNDEELENKLKEILN